MKKGVIFLIFALVFLTGFVSSASVEDALHLNIQTTNAGVITTGTFDFVFNISTTSDCANVVYTNSTSLTTDSRGVISYYLEDTNLNYSEQYWLCYYRGGVLISADKIARTPYAFNARNISLSGVEVDSNLNMTDKNITTTDSGFFGFLGSLVNRVTKIFVQSIDFTVGINGSGNITTTGKIGIGTETPSQSLDVRGVGNFSGTVYINNATDISTLGDNASWNQSFANGLYISSGNLSIYDGLINNASYLSTYNSTYNTWAYNQTTETFNLYNSTWDNRGLINSVNQTIIDSNASWTTTYNQTYADYATANYTNNSNLVDGYDSSYFMPFNTSVSGNFDFNGGWTSGGLSIIGGNLFAQTGYFYNISSLSVTNLNMNGSFFPAFDDQFELGNATWRWKNLYLSGNLFASNIYNKSEVDNNLSLYYLNSNPSGYFNSSNYQSYNATYDAKVADNSSWNQSFANGLYISSGNLSIYDGLINNESYLSTYNSTYDAKVSDNASWNESLAHTLFYNRTSNVNLGSYNLTTLGRVGIGTTSPTSQLSVGGTGVSGAAIYGNGSIFGVYGYSDNNNYGTAGVYAYGDTGVWAESSDTAVIANGSEIGGKFISNVLGVWATAGSTSAWLANDGDGYGVVGNGPIGGYFFGNTIADYALVTGTGNVGIGVNSPAYKLEIANNAKALNVSGFLYANSSNVGIGTATPSAPLHVNSSFSTISNNRGMIVNVTNFESVEGSANLTAGYFEAGERGSSDYIIGVYGKASPNSFNSLSAGVYGVGDYGVYGESNNGACAIYGNGVVKDGIGVIGTTLSNYGVYAVANSGIGLYAISSTGHGIFSSAPKNYFSGNVSIGINSQPYLLSIANSAKALNVSGNLYVNSTNVGIGTANPKLGKLEVDSDGGSNTAIYGNGTDYGVYGYSNNSVGTFGYSLYGVGLSGSGIKGVNGYGTDWDFYGSGGNGSYFSGEVGINNANPLYSLQIENNAKALNVSGMLYVNSSNVGIGTASPTQTFDVRGNGNFSGTIFINNATDISTLGGMPTGAIVAFNLAACPAGWILADGTSGTPDLRGIFVRGSGTNGVLNYANATYGGFSATQGTYNNDSMQGHKHKASTGTGSAIIGGYGSGDTAGVVSAVPDTDGTNGNPRTGLETTPAYYATIYCVKTSGDSATSNTIWAISNNYIIPDNQSLSFNVNNTFVVDSTSGKVGIGTTSPTHTLNVVGNANITGNISAANLYAQRATMWHDEAKVVTGNAILNLGSTSQRYYYYSYQNPAANGDTFTNSFFLKAGTYNFNVLGLTTTTAGKIDWYIDGVKVIVAQDWYTGAGVYNAIKTASVTVTGDGYHQLKGVAVLSGAGGGYYLYFTKYWFVPAADPARE